MKDTVYKVSGKKWIPDGELYKEFYILTHLQPM